MQTRVGRGVGQSHLLVPYSTTSKLIYKPHGSKNKYCAPVSPHWGYPSVKKNNKKKTKQKKNWSDSSQCSHNIMKQAFSYNTVTMETKTVGIENYESRFFPNSHKSHNEGTLSTTERVCFIKLALDMTKMDPYFIILCSIVNPPFECLS